MRTRRDAVGRAIRFLLEQQDQDGGWRDFQLRKGPSTSWTTAYAALPLQEAAARDDRIPGALEAAARFLGRHRELEGGWGYNGRCMADADSTALALLFLHGRRPEPSLKDVAVLARFQNPDGGFATYRHLPSAHPWSASNLELTPTALRALARFLPPDHQILRRGRTWMRETPQTRPGATYWWATPAYMQLERVRIGLCPPPFGSETAPPPSAFEAALALETRARLGAGRHELGRDTQALLALQRADGSWPPSPILRVPGPDIRPGSAALQDVASHTDVRSVFTTATVLSALLALDDLDLTDPPISAASRPFERAATLVPQMTQGADRWPRSRSTA